MDNIAIIGSSGHAKVVIDIVQHQGEYRIVGLLDDKRAVTEHTLGHRVLGQVEDVPRLAREYSLKGAIVAIGDNFARSRVAARVREISPDLPFVSAIHPKASVAVDVSIGAGTVIMSGGCVGPSCFVGSFCILNTNSSLDHDSSMGDFASLAPGVTTGGDCKIGEYSAIGLGAILIHGARIGEHSVVGAGSIVLDPIGASTVAYGAPAKAIRLRQPGDTYL